MTNLCFTFFRRNICMFEHCLNHRNEVVNCLEKHIVFLQVKLNSSSSGSRSGEYGGKERTTISASLKCCTTSETWWTDKLSMIKMDLLAIPSYSCMLGMRLPLTKSRKMSPLTDPLCSSRAKIPSLLMAAMADTQGPLSSKRWHAGYWPRIAYPYFRMLARRSDLVSSIQIRRSRRL